MIPTSPNCPHTSGVMIIPMILMLIWYPQRMLGTATKISTSAALTAEIEMSQGQLNISTDAKCPECDAPVKLSMELDGQISVPCPEEGCETKSGIIGNKCSGCNKEFPSRFNCQSCNTNIPYVDTIPDTEAWYLITYARISTLRGENAPAYLDNACVTSNLILSLTQSVIITACIRVVVVVRYTDTEHKYPV